MDKNRYLTEPEKIDLVHWHEWLDLNRGDRARLRRAESPEDILLTEAFFHFLQHMPESWRENQPMLTSATIAGVLAQVKINKQTGSRIHKSKEVNSLKKMAGFAEQLATPKEGKSKAPMSELRFQQLQKSRSFDDFFRRMIRAVRLLDGQVNIVSLACDITRWHREFEKQMGRNPANRLAVRWATDYYTALPKN